MNIKIKEMIEVIDKSIEELENLKEELVAFRDKLVADPTLQGKGIESYEKIRGNSLIFFSEPHHSISLFHSSCLVSVSVSTPPVSLN